MCSQKSWLEIYLSPKPANNRIKDIEKHQKK